MMTAIERVAHGWDGQVLVIVALVGCFSLGPLLYTSGKSVP